MKRGRKPKPTVVKKYEGNPGKRKLNTEEPQPAVIGIPQPPAWLSPAAVQKFRELAPELVRIGTLTVADVDTFACYCEAFAEMLDCLQLIEERGDYYMTDKGTVLVHPAVYRKNKAIERMYKFGAVLGLNPSNRSSIQIEKTTTSKLKSFL